MELSIRTFIAVKIIPEPNLLELLFHLQKEFAEDVIKWVKPYNFHITLKFLGDTTPFQVTEIKGQLETIAEKYATIQGILEGLSFFKTKGQPRVLFSNIYGTESLSEMVQDIEFETSKLGFLKENRSFKPHLTLARIKSIKNIKNFYRLVDHFRDTEFQQVLINEMIFYQSKLNQSGPVYQPIKMVKFNS